MDYSLNISLKIENDSLELDNNDNIHQSLFNTEIKVEKEVETQDDEDWCVTSLNSCGDLLEPLFFKQVTEPEEPQCPLCYRYFSDRYAIIEHNLTHLQVTIVNPTLHQCDNCASYFTDKQTYKRHILKHTENISKTSSLSYKPKAYNHTRKTMETNSDYNLIDVKMLNEDGNYNSRSFTTNTDEYKRLDYKTNMLKSIPKTRLHNGMTNSLTYKPKACKASMKPQNCDFKSKNDILSYNSSEETFTKGTNKTHRCNICSKSYTYKAWHGHMQQVHGDSDYICGICDLKFKCERYFMRHMAKHATNKKQRKEATKKSKGARRMDVKCDQCDRVLQSLYALTTHKRNVHSDHKYVCDICDSKLKCKSYLLAHMRRVHFIDGKKHFCECGKNFRSHRYLMVHKRNAHSKKKA